MQPTETMLRVRPDDPEYRAMARAEAEFWSKPHPYGLESLEQQLDEGPADFYNNRRYTGEPHLHWDEVICRRGTFRKGIALGTSSMKSEARVLATNPSLHLTFLDISEGAAQRRVDVLGPQFPGRVGMRVADLNFAELERESYDLIISSGSLHHVTNLEHCAAQINRALTPGGYFFLCDYVGEKRFEFTEQKKALYEAIYRREVERQGGRGSPIAWNDGSDLSPFCGVRSDEMLPVLAEYLDEVDVRAAGALAVCLMRGRPSDPAAVRPTGFMPRARRAMRRRLARLTRRGRPQMAIGERFMYELGFVGDMLTDARIILPATAFATYRKRG